MFNKKENPDIRIQTANEFINIKDIKGRILYTIDNHIFSYIRLWPISVDLLSDNEKEYS